MSHGFLAILVSHCSQPNAVPLAREVVRTLQRVTPSRTGKRRGCRRPESDEHPRPHLPLGCAMFCCDEVAVHSLTGQSVSVIEAIEFRQYRAQDHDRVIELHELGLHQTGTDLGAGPWDDDLRSPESVTATYLDGLGDFLVGVLDSVIVVMGGLRSHVSGRAEIKRMRVDPAHQRRGLGRSCSNIWKVVRSTSTTPGSTSTRRRFRFQRSLCTRRAATGRWDVFGVVPSRSSSSRRTSAPIPNALNPRCDDWLDRPGVDAPCLRVRGGRQTAEVIMNWVEDIVRGHEGDLARPVLFHPVERGNVNGDPKLASVERGSCLVFPRTSTGFSWMAPGVRSRRPTPIDIRQCAGVLVRLLRRGRPGTTRC